MRKRRSRPNRSAGSISPEVAAAVRSMLGTVVQDGTGKPAQIAGYSVGGKTGSAQVAGAHGYKSGHFVASFVGMYPLSQPRLVILCAVFEPQGIHWGASVAAPSSTTSPRPPCCNCTSRRTTRRPWTGMTT